MNKNKAVPYLITQGNIVISIDGKHFRIQNTDKGKYDRVVSFIKAKDWDGLVEYLNPSIGIIRYTGKDFFITDDNVHMADTREALPTTLGQRILAFYQQGLPYEPLMAFFRNLRKNPSERSREQLYGFLEANHHPITDDGCFLAYKKVTKTDKGLRDSHSKTFNNDIGQVVKVRWEDVDPDPNQTCSRGLHVAAWEYAQGFSGNVLVEVKVNPAHVVAVPVDYNQQKMRVCQYIVLGKASDAARTEELVDEYVTADPNTGEVDEDFDDTELNGEPENETVVDLRSMTGREIIETVRKLTGKKIAIDLKYKKGIVKKAVEILRSKNFAVKAKAY